MLFGFCKPKAKIKQKKRDGGSEREERDGGQEGEGIGEGEGGG